MDLLMVCSLPSFVCHSAPWCLSYIPTLRSSGQKCRLEEVDELGHIHITDNAKVREVQRERNTTSPIESHLGQPWDTILHLLSAEWLSTP